jgi:hypothetical protein
MASVICQQVIAQVLKIAQSNSTLRQRRTSAIWRIKQFKTELAAAILRRRVVNERVDELARRLRAAAEYWGPSTEGAIFMAALDTLIGEQRKAPPVRG